MPRSEVKCWNSALEGVGTRNSELDTINNDKKALQVDIDKKQMVIPLYGGCYCHVLGSNWNYVYIRFAVTLTRHHVDDAVNSNKISSVALKVINWRHCLLLLLAIKRRNIGIIMAMETAATINHIKCRANCRAVADFCTGREIIWMCVKIRTDLWLHCWQAKHSRW